LNANSTAAKPLIGAPRAATSYRGRFAPSPTGPLHAGSLAAALAAWADARAHHGAFLVRIEDLDPPREEAGATASILATLAAFGLQSDEPVILQSRRGEHYQHAFERLQRAGRVYPCACSRRDIEAVIATRPGWPPGVYPGTCARGAASGRTAHAWRIRVSDAVVAFDDRSAGRHAQNLAREVGDFVVVRADDLWAYQLAVVVDDAEQHISDVVRGADLLDNTPRQIFLQQVLGYPTPRYLHVPVVTDATGVKLSKQTGARAIDSGDVLGELERAWRHLGLPPLGADSPAAFLRCAPRVWRERILGADKIDSTAPARMHTKETPRG
jgi:glutamyl-Q tRNA(Asp) synthetase